MDSAHHTVGHVDVLVQDPAKHTVGSAVTDSGGMFLIRDLPAGVAFQVTARHLGFGAASTIVRELAAGDTVTLHLVLGSTHVLADVKVHGKREMPEIVDSTAIHKLPVQDAARALAYSHILAPAALKSCAQPYIYRVIVDGEERIRIEPPIPPVADSPPPLPKVTDRQPELIEQTLERIDSDSIASMEYVDCWDKDRPMLRGSLVIRLKHPASHSTAMVFSPQPPSGAVAQAPTLPLPVVQGTVADTANHALAGVTVVVQDSTHRTIAFVQSASDGSFLFPNLPAGNVYQVSAQQAALVARPIRLHPLAPGDTVALHFVLSDTTAHKP